MTPDQGDRLCEDLLGVLLRIASHQAVFRMVECMACRQLADPDQPCPHCRTMRVRIAQQRERQRRREMMRAA